MDEAKLILMEKDSNTGFLEKELTAIVVPEEAELLLRWFAQKKEAGGYHIQAELGCDKELTDEEYDIFFELYETETLPPFVESAVLVEGGYDPVLSTTFSWEGRSEVLLEQLNTLLLAHREELMAVFGAMAEKKDDGIDETA